MEKHRILNPLNTSVDSYSCQSCQSHTLNEILGFGNLPRVTSDSKPFKNGGRLFVCDTCGLTQKIPDPVWIAEIERIYADYQMYYQSDTPDQVVFAPTSGEPIGRCELLVQHLKASKAIKNSGVLLDVGAGSGAMLSAFSASFTNWQLSGLDLDNRKLNKLREIRGFDTLYTVTPPELPRLFDLMSLIHSLEHLINPIEFLKQLLEKTSIDGQIFIEVNNVTEVPFDLVVADHLCHFSPYTLHALVGRAGWSVEILATNWARKELSLLAGRQASKSMHSENPAFEGAESAFKRTQRQVDWLVGLITQANELAAAGAIGIFGTSVAATWLASALGSKVAFFVDEDPARKGKTHMGCPIFRPIDAPRGSSVFLAFPNPIAKSIAKRLSNLAAKYIAPVVTC